MPNIILQRFMLFNSSEGQKESREGDKLLFHWTKHIDDYKISLNEQIDDICLCDASVNVSNRLNVDHFYQPEGCCTTRGREHNCTETKPTSQTRSLILTFENALIIILEIEPEQSIWMAVRVGLMESNSEITQNHSNNLNGIPIEAVKIVMSNIYARFCLLNGNFKMIIDDIKSSLDPSSSDKQASLVRERMCSICEDYFGSVVPNIHLNSILSNIASLYNNITYININPITLMKVNSFINHLLCLCAAQIKHTLVIFNEQLLWSSLNIYDTRLLFNYLVDVVDRDALQEELSKEVDKVRRIREEVPIYLIESESAPQENERSNYDSHDRGIRPSEKLIKFYMTVFRSSNNMTLCLIMKEPNLSDLIDKCEQILTNDMRLGVVPLAALAQSVGQNYIKTSSMLSSHPQTHTALQSVSSTSSTSNWRRGSSSSNTGSSSGLHIRSSIPMEQKYISMDRLDSSISWSICMDMLNKENLISDNSGSEQQSSGNKKMRIIRYLIELEPELARIKHITGRRVEEFFAKTSSDFWLMVTNSRYRTIYSIHNIRNASLNEAQKSADNLRSILANNRL